MSVWLRNGLEMAVVNSIEAIVEELADDGKYYVILQGYGGEECIDHVFEKTFETIEEAEKYAERVIDYVVRDVGKGVVDVRVLEKFLETCP